MSALPQRAARAPRAAIHQLRSTLLSARDLLITAGPVLLLALGAIVLAYWLLNPTPPKRMVLATGPAQGAYAEFGRRYQEALKKDGIEVQLQSSRGSLENLQLLREGKVDAAFVQGGAESAPGLSDEEEDEASDLLSLGSLFREPVWVFYRESSAVMAFQRSSLDSLSQLASWKLNIGHEGSGVTNLMRRLLQANGLDTRQMQLGRLEPTPAVMALIDGEIDALALVSAPESPLVRMLLITPGIRLLDFAQAQAYARRVPQVQPIILPRGVVDLAQDLPAQDIQLVAPMATLLVRDDTHPALQQLLVQAAKRIHGEPNWFQHKGEFPQKGVSDHPLAPEAQRFYESGAPLLQRYLPFWMANLVDRMWVVLVSIAALLIPLSRIVPPLYTFRIRSRIFRWYGSLRDIEERAGAADRSESDTRQLLEELADLDARVERLPVPLSHAEELYALRSHIRLVQRRLGGG